jgi:hypothetical protein
MLWRRKTKPQGIDGGMTLAHLPSDVLVTVFLFLKVPDVENVKLVCTTLR